MNFYRRAKLASDAFRNLSSRIVTRAPVQEPTSRILQNGSSNAAKFSGFSSYSCFSKRLGFSVGTTNKNYCFNSMNGIIIGKRYYSVNRYWVQPFRRGPRKGLENLTVVFISVLLVSGGAVIALYFRHLETVPYSNRTRFVFVSKDMEKGLGDYKFQHWKASYKDKILSATHPDSVRVLLITKEIIEALQRGLSLENVGSVRYASSETDEGKSSKEDKWVLWVQHTRGKKGQVMTSHLEGLNWEVMVVNEPVMEAFCIPGGKIVVFTGLLEHFRTDEEIATVIGHEVAHVVARHPAEGLTRNMRFVDSISTLLFKQPLSWNWMIELEADYIGLMLLASAGYDPQVAPKTYEKFESLDQHVDQFSGDNIYPPAKERAQLLAQAKVMEKALSIYRETEK